MEQELSERVLEFLLEYRNLVTSEGDKSDLFELDIIIKDIEDALSE